MAGLMFRRNQEGGSKFRTGIFLPPPEHEQLYKVVVALQKVGIDYISVWGPDMAEGGWLIYFNEPENLESGNDPIEALKKAGILAQ